MRLPSARHLAPHTLRAIITSTLLALLLLLLGVLELTGSYHEFTRQGYTQARVSNQLLSEWIQREFREIELVQNTLSRQLTEEDFRLDNDKSQRSALETRLVRAMHGIPQAYDLILVDPQCKLILSFKVSPGFDARERSYCKALQSTSRNDRFVSERFLTIAGDHVILAAQRVRGDDGKVIGMIGTAVRVEHFQTQINRAMTGSHNDIMVFADRNLQLLARQPMLPALPEKPIDDPSARKMLAENKLQASYEFTSPIDQRTRLHQTSQIENLPIIVTVGIDKDALYRPWWDKLYLFAASWLVMVALIVFATRRYLQNIRLGEALTMHSAAIDHATEAILIANGDGVVEYVNPAYTRMSGVAAEDILHKQELGQVLLGHQPELLQEMQQSIHKGESWRGELASQHLNGNQYYETVSVAPVRDQNGQLVHLIAIKYDITPAKKLQMDLERLANTDELTGLYNRRQFMQRAHEEIARSQRWQRPLTIAMLDLDFFKRLNDRYGHGFGDEVLRRFAHCIQYNVRLEDVCGRLGGEEFAILLPDTDRNNARLIMERVRHAVAEIRLDNPLGGEPVSFTVSIGISELYPGEETPTPMIARADAALYLAKQEGRNNVRSS